MLKGDIIRLQPWFIIRSISWLYIVAYTNGWHKYYKGDWLHRGLSHSFQWWEILVCSLVFISPEGQFGRRYVIPMTARHMFQSSQKVQDGVSFIFKMELAWPRPFLLCTHTHTRRVCFFCCLVNVSRVYIFSLCVISVASTYNLSQSSE